MMREGGQNIEEKIVHGFRLATCRRPDKEELGVLRDIYKFALSRYLANPAAASKLLQVGESPRDKSLDANELAAWTIVASTILNLDETITKG